MIHIWRRVFFAASCAILSCGARASLPMPDPLPLRNYIETFGQLIFAGYFDSVVALPEDVKIQLKDPKSTIRLDDLKFETADANSDNIFLVITGARLIFAKKEDSTLSKIKECNFSKIYISSNFLRAGEDYNSYYKKLIGKEVILFLDPPTQYIGNNFSFSNRFYVTSSGPNWMNGSPMPIDDYGKIVKIANDLKFVTGIDIPCHQRTNAK